jgi:hypothetical protein
MASSYPNTFKIFQTFQDYTDIIFAISVNEIHDEVISIERTLGANPLAGTGYVSIGQGLQDLKTNKADLGHYHDHAALHGDGPPADDHPQYMRTDGSRNFTGPVQSPWAVNNNQLVPIGQLYAQQYINVPQAEWIIGVMLGNLIRGAFPGPPTSPLAGPFPPTPQWTLTGGTMVGVTDGNGWLTCNFGGTFKGMVMAFVATKIPVGPGGGRPAYNYIEAQLTLVVITLGGASVAFSHDYSFQRGLNAAYTWIAIGT